MQTSVAISDLTAVMDAFYRAFALAPGSHYRDEGDCEWYVSSIPFPVFGGAFNVRFDPEDAPRRIREVREAIRSTGAEFVDYAWLALPGYQPENYQDVLLGAGGQVLVNLSGKAMDLTELCPHNPAWSGVDIRPVSSPTEARQYASIYSQLFEAPTETWIDPLMLTEEALFKAGDSLRRYLVWEDGQPLAAGMAMDVAGCAALQTMCTLPEGRNRGIGGALGWRMMSDLRDSGCDRAAVWSSPGAQPLYERLGFRQVIEAPVIVL